MVGSSRCDWARSNASTATRCSRSITPRPCRCWGRGCRRGCFVRWFASWPITLRGQCRHRVRVERKRDPFFLRALLFIFFQRWHFHDGPFRVGAMHRLAVVAQRLLREAFRIPTGAGPFRPRISIRMQGHPFDAKSPTALLELRGPIAGPHGAQIGEERPLRRQLSQRHFHLRTEVQLGVSSGLSSLVAD